MSKTDELAKIIGISANIVFFGGAGMSTESGIPDFRSADGIYNQKLNKRFSPEEMVSHTFLMSHPEEFFEFLFNKMIFGEATPNEGHQALAELESHGQLQAVVTQNIDGLHQKAGSEEVYELHGTVMRWYCMDCGRSYSLDFALQENGKGGVPRCVHCGGVVRPDVVLYEETLNELVLEDAIRAIRKADTLIVGGTSLAVYPAAGLLDYFRGDNLVVINKTATRADTSANLLIREPIGKVLSAAVNKGEDGNMTDLSRLEEITDLRTVWPHEAIDFTPWLSQEDNISLLADAIGIDITVDETESSVGDFNVDIFASETGTDRKVIIEKGV